MDDRDVTNYFMKKLSDKEDVIFDFDSVLGLGGEAIVIRREDNTAIKLSPMNGHVQNVGCFIDSNEAVGNNRPAELIPNELKHINIISYTDCCFQFIESTVFHATGCNMCLYKFSNIVISNAVLRLFIVVILEAKI